jgi:hypothetical protein
MGTISSPISISSSPPLSLRLSQRVDISFNSDDISALIKSIESSQRGNASKLPHLPAEIILHILEYVPIAYILGFRQVCHGFREYIDTGVQVSYLSRTELLGYIGPRKSLLQFLALHDDVYYDLEFMRARFSHLKYAEGSSNVRQSKWSLPYAVFKIDDVWFDTFLQYKELTPYRSDELLEIILGRLSPLQTRTVGTLCWCVRLDDSVMDLEFGSARIETAMEADFEQKTITVKWMEMFKELIHTETKLREMSEAKKSSAWTFGRNEDCLRSVRRERFRSKLDMNVSIDRQVHWSLSTLPPLFGKPRHHQASPPWDQMEHAEDDAARVLMLLRREAAMTPKELSSLKQLVLDRDTMVQDLNNLIIQFKNWTNMMYDAPVEEWAIDETHLPRNPIEWTDETIAKEEQQVRRWKNEEVARGMLEDLLRNSMEHMSVPEDAFDNTQLSGI